MFLVKNFPVGQRVLVDSSFGQPTTQGEARKEEATRQGELPLVKEVLLVALGSRQSRPYLLVSTGQRHCPCASLPRARARTPCPADPAPAPRCTWTRSCSFTRPSPMTRSLARGTSKSASRRCCGVGSGGGPAGLTGAPALTLPPRQVPHNINFREKKPKPSKKKAEGGAAEEGAGARGRVARFRYFEDIYGYSGVGRQLWGSPQAVGPCPCGLLTVPPPGVHLRSFAPLAPGDRPGRPAAASYGHRWPHRLLRPVSQRQLPPWFPVLQQTGRGLAKLQPTGADAAQGRNRC